MRKLPLIFGLVFLMSIVSAVAVNPLLNGLDHVYYLNMTLTDSMNKTNLSMIGSLANTTGFFGTTYYFRNSSSIYLTGQTGNYGYIDAMAVCFTLNYTNYTFGGSIGRQFIVGTLNATTTPFAGWYIEVWNSTTADKQQGLHFANENTVGTVGETYSANGSMIGFGIYDVCVSWNGSQSSGKYFMYFNGTEVNYNSAYVVYGTSNMSPSPRNLTIGRHSAASVSDRNLYGSIENLYIWNRAINATEASAVHNNNMKKIPITSASFNASDYNYTAPPPLSSYADPKNNISGYGLYVNSNYDNGAIGNLSVIVNSSFVNITFPVDPMGLAAFDDARMWIRFNVSNVSGKKITFELYNYTLGRYYGDLYNSSATDVQMLWKCSNDMNSTNWTRASDLIRWWNTSNEHVFSYVFNITFPCNASQIATALPFSKTDMDNYVTSISGNSYVRIKNLTYSNYFGFPIYQICVTNYSLANDTKNVSYNIGRQHEQEVLGTIHQIDTINYLISNDLGAKNIRDNFIACFVPMMNPDGVWLGWDRSVPIDNQTTVEGNRFYGSGNLVNAVSAVESDIAYFVSIGKTPSLFTDWHGWGNADTNGGFYIENESYNNVTYWALFNGLHAVVSGNYYMNQYVIDSHPTSCGTTCNSRMWFSWLYNKTTTTVESSQSVKTLTFEQYNYDDINFTRKLYSLLGVNLSYSAPPSNYTCYKDLDSDGFGNTSSLFYSNTTCSAGNVSIGGDCNDANAGINPNATEICGNGIDENCDGIDASCCSATDYGFVKINYAINYFNFTNSSMNTLFGLAPSSDHQIIVCLYDNTTLSLVANSCKSYLSGEYVSGSTIETSSGINSSLLIPGHNYSFSLTIGRIRYQSGTNTGKYDWGLLFKYQPVVQMYTCGNTLPIWATNDCLTPWSYGYTTSNRVYVASNICDDGNGAHYDTTSLAVSPINATMLSSRVSDSITLGTNYTLNTCIGMSGAAYGIGCGGGSCSDIIGKYVALGYSAGTFSSENETSLFDSSFFNTTYYSNSFTYNNLCDVGTATFSNGIFQSSGSYSWMSSARHSVTFSFYDEDSLQQLMYIPLKLFGISFSYNGSSGTGNSIYLDWLPSGLYGLLYGGGSSVYKQRAYYFNVPVVSSNVTIQLYLLNISMGTQFLYYVVDQNSQLPWSGYLMLERAYIVQNVTYNYVPVEIASIDSQGNAIFTAIQYTQPYRFVILDQYLNVVDTKQPNYLTSIQPTQPLVVKLSTGFMTSYYGGMAIQYSTLYDNATGLYYFTFNDPNNQISRCCLSYVNTQGVNLTDFSTCQSGYSGSIITLLPQQGTYNINMYCTFSGSDQTIATDYLSFPTDVSLIFADVVSVILTILIVLAAVSTGFKDPIASILMIVGVFCVFSLGFLGMFSILPYLLGGLFVVAIIILWLVYR